MHHESSLGLQPVLAGGIPFQTQANETKSCYKCLDQVGGVTRRMVLGFSNILTPPGPLKEARKERGRWGEGGRSSEPAPATATRIKR
jgi:hypothetical protein